nr:MAG TPA: hypothetical protein [Caudoviricetes sp.]
MFSKSAGHCVGLFLVQETLRGFIRYASFVSQTVLMSG